MSATAARPDPFKPARRVAGQRQDVWYEMTKIRAGLSNCFRSIVNEAATASPVQPIVNMGQGFL